nr:MFS transporter [Microbulbifer rhizosphaerae]
MAALTVMAGATVAPSLPALENHFADSANSELLTRLVLTLPALFIALFAPLAGVVSDRFGRRRLLLSSVLLYGLAGVSGLLADSLPGILVGRALLGIAVAGTMTSVTALVGDYFSGAEQGKYMAQQGAFISFGGVVFLVLGGLLADLHWRAPFAVYAIALLLLPAALFFLGEPVRDRDTAESAGNAAQVPYFPLAALFAAALLNSLVFYLIPTQLPFLLREIGTVLPSHAGQAIAGGNLMGAVSSLFFYRRIRERLGAPGLFAFCFAFMAAGMLLISAADSFAAVMAATAVYGVGMGALMPHLFASAIHLASERMRGRISGGLTTSIFIGQFLSPLASQPWIDRFGLAAGFSFAGMLLLLPASAVAAATLWRLLERT